MSPEEIVDFLSSRRTGVLALPAAQQPYAIPISYAFDERADELLLRLARLDEAEKDQYLDDRTPARVVVYDMGGPRSVIVDGTLVELDADDLDPETIRALGDGETPAFDLWPGDKPDLDVTIYRLTEVEMTGRKPPE